MPRLDCPGCQQQIDGRDVFGFEDPAIYDGVLYWGCARCGHAFPRDFTNPRLLRASQRAAAFRNLRGGD